MFVSRNDFRQRSDYEFGLPQLIRGHGVKGSNGKLPSLFIVVTKQRPPAITGQATPRPSSANHFTLWSVEKRTGELFLADAIPDALGPQNCAPSSAGAQDAGIRISLGRATPPRHFDRKVAAVRPAINKGWLRMQAAVSAYPKATTNLSSVPHLDVSLETTSQLREVSINGTSNGDRVLAVLPRTSSR